jgi:hypothetical protein
MNFSEKNNNEILENIGNEIVDSLLKGNNININTNNNNNNNNINFEGVVFPPIEYLSIEELRILFKNYNRIFEKNPKFSIKFLEFQIKIKMKNYNKIKDFINFLFFEFKNLENFAITLYFYNIKINSVLKMTENILIIIYEKLKERKINYFFLKLFFVMPENNSVEYKYFIYQENEKYLLRKNQGEFSPNKNRILKTSPKIKEKKLNIEKEKNMKGKSDNDNENNNYIDVLINCKVLQKIIFNKNIKKKLEDFLKAKQIPKSSTNTSNNNSISSFHHSENHSQHSNLTNQSESYLISTMKEFKVEKTIRKFLINQKNPDNFHSGYKDFYTELYKIS